MKNLPTIFLLLALLISGCASQAAAPAEITLPAATQSSQPPTATFEPSPTPLPGKIILVAPPGSDSQPVQNLLAELSGPEGLSLETQTELQPGMLEPSVRLVVFLDPPANLNEIISSASQTQFLAISGTDLPAAANLSLIRRRPENQAFVGGFISVLLSTDWRSGGLLPSDSTLGGSLQEAFVNGGRYFCGACGPGWPLGVYYPQVEVVPAASDGPTWQAAAGRLFDNMKVEAYYLSAQAYRPEVLDYLTGLQQFDKTVLLVGALPPPDALRAQWAATVGFDVLSPLRQVWPDLLAGKSGVVLEAPLVLLDVNTTNLGEGRLRLVNSLMDEIKAGRVYPFTLPPE